MNHNVEVLVPYKGPTDSETTQDIMVFMRPETNGVVGERAILNTIGKCEKYKKKIQLIYMANVSSRALISNRIYERYYAMKIHFATRGSAIFTHYMKRAFGEYFGVEFESAHVIGAFEALREFSLSARELFDIWVGEESVCVINGQSIKKYKHAFIVNCEVPELLHRHYLKHDIAVMCFRMDLSYEYFYSLIKGIKTEMVRERLIATYDNIERAFHYSSGPFDQLIDAQSFMFHPNGEAIPLGHLSFARYLQERNVSVDIVAHIIVNPIVTICDPATHRVRETSIIDYTRGDSYASAYKNLCDAVAYSCIDPLPL